MKYCVYIAIGLSLATSFAEQYQIFDGQVYNGLHYPNIDILEWGEPAHLEFQIYDKKNPIHISGQTVEINGRQLFQVAIDLAFRGERRCRRIIAPASFKKGQQLHYYIDKSDNDMNNIIVSAQPLTGKVPYTAPPFHGCTEQAANSSSPETQIKNHKQPLEEMKDIIIVDLNEPTQQRRVASAEPEPTVQINPELHPNTSVPSPQSEASPIPTPIRDAPNDGAITATKDYDWFSNK